MFVLPEVLPRTAETTRTTEKGQATIPKGIRVKYGLDPGDEAVWEETDEGIVVRKTSRRAYGELLPEDTSEEKREEVARELEARPEELRERTQPDTATR